MFKILQKRSINYSKIKVEKLHSTTDIERKRKKYGQTFSGRSRTYNMDFALFANDDDLKLIKKENGAPAHIYYYKVNV